MQDGRARRACLPAMTSDSTGAHPPDSQADPKLCRTAAQPLPPAVPGALAQGRILYCIHTVTAFSMQEWHSEC